MDDLDDLLPGVETKQVNKKEKKTNYTDFFNQNNQSKSKTLAGFFSANQDNKQTVIDDDPKPNKADNAILIPQENELFDRRGKRKITNTVNFDNIQIEPEKKAERDLSQNQKTIGFPTSLSPSVNPPVEQNDDDVGSYQPSRRRKQNTIKANEDNKPGIKMTQTTPNFFPNPTSVIKEEEQAPKTLSRFNNRFARFEENNRSDSGDKKKLSFGDDHNRSDSQDQKENLIYNQSNSYNKNEFENSQNLNSRIENKSPNHANQRSSFKPQVETTSDPYIMRIEKDNFEQQINFQKQKLEDERKRYEEMLKNEYEKSKKKEEEMNKFIDELRERHKLELKSQDETYKKNLDNLLEENKKLRREIDTEIAHERERMQILHRSDIENLENLHKRNLEDQKRFFEDQNNSIKTQLHTNIEFNKLANKVELSSKQIEDILLKFFKDKEKGIENDKMSIESKERFLNDFGEKLKTYEQTLQKEREQIMETKREIESKDYERKRELQEEKAKIDKEINRLHELQSNLKILEYNAKEKFDREKLEIEHKMNQFKMETDSIKNEYLQKLNDVEYQRKMLNEEKNFFEKYKEESMKNIDLKKNSLEERKKQFYDEEREINSRKKVLQEQDFYLKEKFDEFEKIKSEFSDERKRLDYDKKELLISVSKFKEHMKTFEEKNWNLEKEKEKFEKRFQEVEAERIYLNTEKIKIEQAKTELRLRMQSMDALRIKYVSSVTDNVGIGLNMNETLFKQTNQFPVEKQIMKNNFTSSKTNFGYSTDMKKDSAKQSFRRSFNCDEYLSNLKVKLGNNHSVNQHTPNNFNDFIYQEKEYLKRSRAESFGPDKDIDSDIRKEIDKINHKNLGQTNPNFEYSNITSPPNYYNNEMHKQSNLMKKNYEDVKVTNQNNIELVNTYIEKEEKQNNSIYNNQSQKVDLGNNIKNNISSEFKFETTPLHYNKVKIDEHEFEQPKPQTKEHSEKVKKVFEDDEFDY